MVRPNDVPGGLPGGAPADRRFYARHPERARPLVAKLHECLLTIRRQVAYIRERLPERTLPDENRREVEALCTDIWWTIEDVRKEVMTLEDKLGLRPGLPPYDPDIRNPDPSGNLRWIEDWLREDLDKLAPVLNRTLNAQLEPRLERALLAVLLVESAMNMAEAERGVRETVAAIRNEIGQGSGSKGEERRS